MVQYKGYISLEYGKVSSISSTHPENPTNLLNWRFTLVTDRKSNQPLELKVQTRDWQKIQPTSWTESSNSWLTENPTNFLNWRFKLVTDRKSNQPLELKVQTRDWQKIQPTSWTEGLNSWLTETSTVPRIIYNMCYCFSQLNMANSTCSTILVDNSILRFSLVVIVVKKLLNNIILTFEYRKHVTVFLKKSYLFTWENHMKGLRKHNLNKY